MQPEQKPEPLIPIKDVAKHFTVSVSTVRAWVRQGHIPRSTYVKIGNTYRFNLAEILASLTKNPSADPQSVVTEAELTALSTQPVQLELDFANPDKDI